MVEKVPKNSWCRWAASTAPSIDLACNFLLGVASVVADSVYAEMKLTGDLPDLDPQPFRGKQVTLSPHFPDQPRGCVVIR